MSDDRKLRIDRPDLVAAIRTDKYPQQLNGQVFLEDRIGGETRDIYPGHCLCFNQSNPKAYIQTTIASSELANYEIVVRGVGTSNLFAADATGETVTIRPVKPITSSDEYYLHYILFKNISTGKVDHLFECEEGGGSILYDAVTGATASVQNVASLSALRQTNNEKQYLMDENAEDTRILLDDDLTTLSNLVRSPHDVFIDRAPFSICFTLLNMDLSKFWDNTTGVITQYLCTNQSYTNYSGSSYYRINGVKVSLTRYSDSIARLELNIGTEESEAEDPTSRYRLNISSYYYDMPKAQFDVLFAGACKVVITVKDTYVSAGALDVGFYINDTVKHAPTSVSPVYNKGIEIAVDTAKRAQIKLHSNSEYGDSNNFADRLLLSYGFSRVAVFNYDLDTDDNVFGYAVSDYMSGRLPDRTLLVSQIDRATNGYMRGYAYDNVTYYDAEGNEYSSDTGLNFKIVKAVIQPSETVLQYSWPTPYFPAIQPMGSWFWMDWDMTYNATPINAFVVRLLPVGTNFANTHFSIVKYKVFEPYVSAWYNLPNAGQGRLYSADLAAACPVGERKHFRVLAQVTPTKYVQEDLTNFYAELVYNTSGTTLPLNAILENFKLTSVGALTFTDSLSRKYCDGNTYLLDNTGNANNLRVLSSTAVFPNQKYGTWVNAVGGLKSETGIFIPRKVLG